MSYTGTVSGHYAIDPPLKWSEIRDSPFLLENQTSHSQDTDVVLKPEREEEESDTGVLITITCSSAVPCRDAFDCRALEGETTAFMEAMKAMGRMVRGVMTVQPHEYGDGGVWRVVVDGGGVRSEAARLLWPDGSTVDLP